MCATRSYSVTLKFAAARTRSIIAIYLGTGQQRAGRQARRQRGEVGRLMGVRVIGERTSAAV